jgi:hypothetical protein
MPSLMVSIVDTPGCYLISNVCGAGITDGGVEAKCNHAGDSLT